MLISFVGVCTRVCALPCVRFGCRASLYHRIYTLLSLLYGGGGEGSTCFSRTVNERVCALEKTQIKQNQKMKTVLKELNRGGDAAKPIHSAYAHCDVELLWASLSVVCGIPSPFPPPSGSLQRSRTHLNLPHFLFLSLSLVYFSITHIKTLRHSFVVLFVSLEAPSCCILSFFLSFSS